MENRVQGTIGEQYKGLVDNINDLPSLPEIVARLIKVVNSPDTSADDAAKLIEKDPALTSKMIRLANSAFYGIPRSISSVSSAVVILGFNTIRSLVLSVSIIKMFPGENQKAIDIDRFWKHSIVTALAAKILVRHFFSTRMMDPESAFCAGILHDLGKLIFNEYASDGYKQACEYSKANGVPLLEAESRVLGINHSEVGGMLSEKWALPVDLDHSLVYHHSPGRAKDITELVTIVHIADILAHHLGYGLWDNEPVVEEWEKARAVLNINDSDYQKVSETLTQNLEKTVEFFNIIK